LTYTIDFPVLLLFFAVFLDVISTSLFVTLNVGTEANFILKDLIAISIWFIPIYLLSTNALFIPFLSDLLRKTFSYTFGFVSISLALNNFSLLIFNNALLVDTLGFSAMVIVFVLFGLAIFVYLVKKEMLNRKEIVSKCLNLFLFCIFLGLLQSLFIFISWLFG
jgi:hypothetical protein